MKKLFLLFVLSLATAISYSQCSKYKEYSTLQLSVNYGIEKTMGGELLIQHNKNIIGFGYVGYIGTNTGNLMLDNDHYHYKNEALYLTYARQIDNWVVGVKFGKQNNADWNKKVLGYTPSGGIASYTFEKDANEYTTMVGASVGYCLTNRFRLNLGIDSFSTATLGFTAGF